MTMRLSKQ